MKRVVLYTDGACLGNPGPGGWAALEGLKALKEPCEVDLYTDSQYLQKAFAEGWLERWEANGWRSSGGQAVKNQDLWKALVEVLKVHRVRFHWVKGHAGHRDNERVDRAARRQAELARVAG